MFTDYWVIAQLLAQSCALALLSYASVFGVQSLRYWVAESDTSLQLQLERQNYLMSAIMQVGLWFQVLSLLMFLHTVNEHLPAIVKGAMCATGTLGINAWGYPLLALKSISIFVYVIYLFINYLDNQEPAYPLTPSKYIWLYPALILAVMDFYALIQYFSNIKPDLIATCCSVDFTAIDNSPYALGRQGGYLSGVVSIWIGSFIFLLGIIFFKLLQKNIIWSLLGLLASVCYVASSIYTLKYIFVKHIYGLPSHLCLFDIFWIKYYNIGYLLFTAYYAVILGVLGCVTWQITKSKLSKASLNFQKNMHLTILCGLLISFLVPIGYWILRGYTF